MSRKKIAWGALTGLVVLLLASIASLLENVVAADAKWPGPLDYLRRYPWPMLGATLIAICVISSLRYSGAHKNKDVAKDPAHPDMRDWVVNGTVNVLTAHQASGADQGSVVGGEPENGSPRDSAQVPVILYVVSPFCGDWEEKVFAAIDEAAPDAIYGQLERNHASLGVVAILVIFPTAQLDIIERTIKAKLREAKQNFPPVRVILAAVDLSDVPIDEESGHAMLRAAGYKMDSAKFLICPTADGFHASLSSEIRVAVRGSAMQSRLDKMNQASTLDQEDSR